MCLAYDYNTNADRNGTNDEGSSCSSVAQLVQNVIVRLDLTTEECLEHIQNETDARTTSAEGESIVNFVLNFYLSAISLQHMDMDS